MELISEKDIIIDSPLCARSNQNMNFDFAVCVENNEKRKRVLEKRLEKIMPIDNFEVIKGDCNDVIGNVIQLINNKFQIYSSLLEYWIT